MKQFIYLDTDIVNSIIAQSKQGLIMNFLNEESQSQADTSSKIGHVGLAGSISSKLMRFLKAEGTLNIGGEIGKEIQEQRLDKEITTKILHDAAFDISYNIIKGKIENKPSDIGSYVEEKRIYDFVDIEYLESLSNEGSLFSYLQKQQKISMKKSVKESIPPGKMSRVKDEVNKMIRESTKEYDEMKEVIKLISNIIPYKKMLVSNNGFLVPLEDRYFRVNPKTLGFQFGGEITCVGMTTNIIGKDTDPNDKDNIFSTVQFSINELLRIILPTDEDNLLIIHPIAIYYSNNIGE